MSVDPTANVTFVVKLIDRKTVTPTGITAGEIVAGDLSSHHLKMEVTNTANTLTDHCRLTLRIDPLGTFIRTAPNLVDENAKFNYLIEYQITQAGSTSKFWRFEISQAIVQEDEVFGEVLIVTGRGREYILREQHSSRPLIFRTPKDAFEDRLTDFAGMAVGGDGARLGNTDIVLPVDPKQNYIPNGPIDLHQLLKQVIDRLALPASTGGVLTDFYWDCDADPTDSRIFDVLAKEFGSLPVADGDRVEINPLSVSTAEQKDKNIVTDSEVFKNQVILRGSPSHGSLPMDHVRFASNFENARRRPEWSDTVTYKDNDIDGTSLVKRTFAPVSGCTNCPNIIRFFKANTDNITGFPAPELSALWDEDFSIYPEFIANGSYKKGNVVTETGGTVRFFQNKIAQEATNAFTFDVTLPSLDSPTNWDELLPAQAVARYTTFETHTPWTNNAPAWLQNMTDNPPVGFAGAFVDWNFVRANYDPASKPDFTTEFDHISIKWVTRIDNTPPTGDEEFNGQRILVGTSPTGVFATHANQVAQFFGPAFLIGPSVGWKFSKAPDTDDTLINMDNGKIYRWTGTWVVAWDPDVDFGVSAPIHLVKDIRYVASPGGDGVANQGLEFEFGWDIATSSRHLTSRGMWINFWFPFPRQVQGSIDIGDIYGGQVGSTFDARNLNFNHLGQFGWNRGKNSEDMGRISALSMKLRASFLDPDGLIIKRGHSNQPFTFFAVDLFDRVFFYDFTLKRNGGWENVVIPFGERSRKNLYFNRTDELLTILGWNPFGDFFLAEREYTGVTFDWRFVKMWGIQHKGSYDDAGLYKGSVAESIFDVFTSAFQYVVDNTEEIQAQDIIEVDVETTRLAIADLHFIKELYVVSDDTQVVDSRIEVYNRESEIDYNSAKISAQGRRERTKFFPQRVILTSFGDVRLRSGHRFLIKGDKVPGGEQEVVTQEVKHIIDAGSYKMQVTAIRKFVLP